MPGKLRVHELAKQLGVTSKELLATLKEQGEFVKTASSTIEPPVVKKMRAHYEAQSGGDDAAEKKQDNKPAKGAAKSTAKASAPKPGAKSAAPKPGAEAPKPGAKAAAPKRAHRPRSLVLRLPHRSQARAHRSQARLAARSRASVRPQATPCLVLCRSQAVPVV